METITHSQVQELVMQLPAAKLPLVYTFLNDLAAQQAEVQSPQFSFMLLPLSERRRLMVQQAQQMVAHYEESAEERQAWQAGGFVDEY
ncbi:hypothetical protein HUU05_14560 [candidate division KSB1 bacterium]|nr:hypothetical protein [candidate division KSB1 bacterium]